MAKEPDNIIEDEDPLYIRISKKKHAILVEAQSELVRLRGSIRRALRPKRKSKS